MKLGFIGTGNMASAIIGGVIQKKLVTPEDIIGADVFAPGREKAKFGIQVTADNNEVVRNANLVFLSVKPQFYEEVIRGIKSEVRPEQIIITIAPGKTLAWLREQFGKDVKLVRCMPNTPALVGEGMTAACPCELITEEELDTVKKILSSFSCVEIVPERLMDTVTAVSGSSPAFVFMFIEAMADSAVCCGMPRAQAYKFAAQAVPIVGAAAGATLNTMFTDYYQDMARGHFIVRRLELKYGEDVVRTCYDRVAHGGVLIEPTL